MLVLIEILILHLLILITDASNVSFCQLPVPRNDGRQLCSSMLPPRCKHVQHSVCKRGAQSMRSTPCRSVPACLRSRREGDGTFLDDSLYQNSRHCWGSRLWLYGGALCAPGGTWHLKMRVPCLGLPRAPGMGWPSSGPSGARGVMPSDPRHPLLLA